MFQPSRRDFLKRSSLLALSGGVLAAPCCGARCRSRASSKRETSFGRVRGTDVDGVKTFKGIPYGASTAGPNRFMPPTDPARWSSVRDALDYGPSAPQRDPAAARAADSGLSVASAGLPAESEDCLVLNVWTPALDGAKRPVMLWCHGGGFATGSGSSPVTDGAQSRAARRRRRRVDQPPPQRARLYLSRRSDRAGGRAVGRRRHARHRARAAMGAREHLALRRRSRPRDGLRPVRRRAEGRDAARDAVRRKGFSTARSSRAARRSSSSSATRPRASRASSPRSSSSVSLRCTISRPCRSTGSCARTSRPCAT